MAERKQFLLRIDQGLWEDLEAWAADELRSVNGQIEYVLREAVRKRKGTSYGPGSEAAEVPEPPPAQDVKTAADKAWPARTGKKGPRR